MCFTLYIGSSVKLPLVDWNKDQPSVHTMELKDYEQGVVSRFTLPHVLYIGSDQGCGCGFRHGIGEGKDWLPIVDDDIDAFDEVQKNHRDLCKYLTDNAAAGNVELYACWNSDVTDAAVGVSDIGIEDIADENFYFKEGWLYKVTVG